MIKRSQETETLVLLMLLLITITSTGHHKSAKLKKYLSLKYEYATASLYLLWCSGDIEVHPGPSLNKKTLANDSAIQRRWIQNISPKILVLLPEHEQSKSNPSKKVRHERENREYFKTLLKKCEEEKVNVPKMYLAEINAWETMKYKLLHKLFVYRCEFETIITSLKDFLTYGGRNSDLTNINVSLITDLKTNEIATDLRKDQRPKKQSQLIVYIIRFIAGISIKCAHGKNTDAKCDGLWDQPLENWPTDIVLFDPNNRGKYSKKSPGKLTSDQTLVDNLIDLPQVTIPQKYTEIVDAYKLMRKSHTKQHKLELCSTFKRIVSLEKLDFALKNLSEARILTDEIHEILTKWWTTGAVETGDDRTLSLENMDDAKKNERPHILINISTKCITLTVQEPTSANSSQVSYDFPFKDEIVPLMTMATSVSQTTIQKPLNDISSATKDSHNLDFNKQVSPTSDMGSSDAKSSVNSESRNDKVDQNIISNGSQVLLTNSDYSSDSSCNYLSTNMKKRKCTEEEKKEMNKRRKTSPKQDKEQTETNHQKTSVATSTILDKNTDVFMEEFNIELDSFELNDSYLYDDKNQHNSDKAGSLIKDCSQISYENTNASANYKTEFSTELDKFLQDMINGDGKKNVTNELIFI
ncbi:unnamed protein product [Mytilus edulis]|uniref:Uncharacterized protein n=1 Tax=Mytilus edulis TaxID=6550 RepID=A0A8S3UCZ4_MYTED|nr:unnamed protein product [Mytilus edulis]